MVGQRDDGWIDLGECQLGQVRSLPSIMAELESKIPHYPLPKGCSVGRRLFLHHKPSAKTAFGMEVTGPGRKQSGRLQQPA